MKRCPICGENYSASYKHCPFCEEEAALRQGDQIRRGAGNGKRPSGPKLLSPILIVLIVLMAALLVYLLLGDRIAEHFQKEGGEEKPPVEDTLPDGTMPGDEDQEETDPVEPKPDEKDDQDDKNNKDDKDDQDSKDDHKNSKEEKPSVKGGLTYQQAAALPEGLTLNSTDFTLRGVNEVCKLTASGGSGTYQWISENPKVASVNQNGEVSALSKGTATIIVTDGKKRAECIARINVPEGAQGTPTDSTGSAKLNRDDMTISVGEKFQLKLSGVKASPTWSSSNSGIASVAGDGTVTGMASGKTTITASWDGGSKSCTVYVKK